MFWFNSRLAGGDDNPPSNQQLVDGMHTGDKILGDRIATDEETSRYLLELEQRNGIEAE